MDQLLLYPVIAYIIFRISINTSQSRLFSLMLHYSIMTEVNIPFFLLYGYYYKNIYILHIICSAKKKTPLSVCSRAVVLFFRHFFPFFLLFQLKFFQLSEEMNAFPPFMAIYLTRCGNEMHFAAVADFSNDNFLN